MKKFSVEFQENGEEYSGFLLIECKTFKKVNETTIKVNGALIEIDEDIVKIKELKK